MKRTLLQTVLPLSFALALAVVSPVQAQNECPCVAPNVGGTATLMPTSCNVGYLGLMFIVDGLLAGDTINISAELGQFFNTSEVPGGDLGGSIQTFDAILELQMTGTGTLAAFNRLIFMQVAGVAHSAPRNPGDAVQSFSHELKSLSGSIFGDPDFDFIHVLAGSQQALPPSPGQTTLTRLGGLGTDFQVDSFFDITYTIDFQGAPGSVLENRGGVTEDTRRFQLCQQPVAVQSEAWGAMKSLYRE